MVSCNMLKAQAPWLVPPFFYLEAMVRVSKLMGAVKGRTGLRLITPLSSLRK